MAGNGGDQQGAELGGEGVFPGGAGPGGEPFQSHAGIRAEVEQAFGVFADHIEILLRHADQDQVGKRFLRFGIGGENLLVDGGGFVAVAEGLESGGFAEGGIFMAGGKLQAAVE